MKYNLLWFATKQLRASHWLYQRIFDLGLAWHSYRKYGKRASAMNIEDFNPHFTWYYQYKERFDKAALNLTDEQFDAMLDDMDKLLMKEK